MTHYQDGPELVFGLVGPIGADMSCVSEELGLALRQVGYESHLVHITSIIPELLSESGQKTLKQKIEAANDLRSRTKDNSILAGIAITEIKKIRSEQNSKKREAEGKIPHSEIQLNRTAYIIRQLKRDEEISLLRKVYGNNFIQISVAIDESKQLLNTQNMVARQEPDLTPASREELARELINTDKQELSNNFGQRMLEAYQSADFFVTGEARDEISKSVSRFIRAMFGYNMVSPTKEEFGAVLAKTASLRSVDLSRQVGAAIISPDGELISLGCNEVPAAGGGQYWGEDLTAARDIEIGADPNKIETAGIIESFLKHLERSGALNSDWESVYEDKNFKEGLKELAISDITEFGRITHAEMSAITEAARLGRPLVGSTMIVTTFPCHNCAKHIVASGIKKVIYIEPYAKSRALHLHQDSITTSSEVTGKVTFEHFRGISPRRFQTIFQKGRRKNKVHHTAESWFHGEPTSLFSEVTPFHTHREIDIVKTTLQKISESG